MDMGFIYRRLLGRFARERVDLRYAYSVIIRYTCVADDGHLDDAVTLDLEDVVDRADHHPAHLCSVGVALV